MRKKGFTLIELMVVIAIIGIVASVVTASLLTARKKGRDGRRVADMNQLKTALELYTNYNFGLYPTTGQGLNQLTGATTCGNAPCMRSIPFPPDLSLQANYDYCDGTGATSFTLHAIFELAIDKPAAPTTPSPGCTNPPATFNCNGATDYCAKP